MILVICGTNRPNSKTAIVSKYIFEFLKADNSDVEYMTLEDYAEELIHSDMYSADKMSQKLKSFQDDKFIPADKLIIVSPEYNGSFPGVLKSFIDALSVRKYADTFKNKKVALVGVATGRAGNLRGMDHLTGFMNYLKMHVYPIKLPLSQIDTLMENGEILKDKVKPLHDLMQDFMEY